MSKHRLGFKILSKVGVIGKFFRDLGAKCCHIWESLPKEQSLIFLILPAPNSFIKGISKNSNVADTKIK
jgi:hypothetical protein